MSILYGCQEGSEPLAAKLDFTLPVRLFKTPLEKASRLRTQGVDTHNQEAFRRFSALNFSRLVPPPC
jgi:hypothetical protein